jgi:hypothetical protein
MGGDANGSDDAMKFSDWIQSLDFVTQSAHFFAGAAATIGLGLWLPWYWSAAIFLGLWACPKELLYDWQPWGEGHGQPDWLDLVFYSIGAAVGCGLLLLKGL